MLNQMNTNEGENLRGKWKGVITHNLWHKNRKLSHALVLFHGYYSVWTHIALICSGTLEISTGL